VGKGARLPWHESMCVADAEFGYLSKALPAMRGRQAHLGAASTSRTRTRTDGGQVLCTLAEVAGLSGEE
jgi:hypothetical protein